MAVGVCAWGCGAGKLHGWIGETLDSLPGIDRRCREREERAVPPGPSALRAPGGSRHGAPPGLGIPPLPPAGAASQRLIAALLSALTLRSAIRMLHHQQTHPAPVSRSCRAAASLHPESVHPVSPTCSAALCLPRPSSPIPTSTAELGARPSADSPHSAQRVH